MHSITIKGWLCRNRRTIGYIAMAISLMQPAAIVNLAAAAERSKLADLYTVQFAASSESFAFLRESGGFTPDLVVYSLAQKKVTIYRSQRLKVWSLSPNASRDGGFFVIYWKQKTPEDIRSGKTPVMHLLRCANATCMAVFDFHGAIQSAIDLGNGKVLFVGGVPAIFHRPLTPDFVSFEKFDFYYRNGPGSMDRLTNWEAARLGSASLGEGRLVFDFSATPGKPTPQPIYPLTKSSIWSAAFKSDGSEPQIKLEGDRPFIQYGRESDTQPSISPDGSKTAFNSSSEYIGKERRYDIVIVDNSSKREVFTIVPGTHTKFSYPVFVNDDLVRFMGFDGATYSFGQFSLSAKREEALGRIAVDDLAHAEIVDIPEIVDVQGQKGGR